MALLAGLLDALFTASFRGVPFAILDSREDTGRRWQRFFFPGSDASAWEDLGALDGPISINGLIIGDDYALAAEDLRQAFRAPGPGTLVHPWYGTLEVVLREPAQISFNQTELRVARIIAAFVRYAPPAPSVLDPLYQALAAVRSVRYQAQVWLTAVLAPARLALGIAAAVGNFTASFRSVLNTLTLSSSAGIAVAPRLTAPYAGLTAVAATPVDAAYPASVSAAIAAPAAAIAAASITPAPSAIGGVTQATAPITERQAAQLLLDLSAASVPAPAVAPITSLALACRAHALAGAAEAITAIPFESQAEALAWRGRFDTAIAGAMDAAVRIAASDPAGAGPLWSALGDLRAAVAADLQLVIGRLPAVVSLRVPVASSAWQVANHLAGDDPAQILEQYRDLVARNRLRQPGFIPAGTTLERLA